MSTAFSPAFGPSRSGRSTRLKWAWCQLQIARDASIGAAGANWCQLVPTPIGTTTQGYRERWCQLVQHPIGVHQLAPPGQRPPNLRRFRHEREIWTLTPGGQGSGRAEAFCADCADFAAGGCGGKRRRRKSPQARRDRRMTAPDFTRRCADCRHLTRVQTCREPVAAGLIPACAGYGIAWPPPAHAAVCSGFQRKLEGEAP